MATIGYSIARIDPNQNAATGQYHVFAVTDDVPTLNTVVATVYNRSRAQSIADDLTAAI